MTTSDGADRAAWERSNELHPIDIPTAEGLLREAKGILDRHGVVFFLRQGTCLGAIREGALISWDDDMDLGSVIGLHGLTEDAIGPVVTSFREAGFFASVEPGDHGIAVSFVRSFIRLDWTSYRVLDGCIFQYPAVRIPVSLFTHLKEIDFIGAKFLVPDPPEEYLRLKYGDEWRIPKKVGYEQDVVGLIPEGPVPGRAGRLRQTLSRYLMPGRAGRLRVLDHDGRPVSGSEVVVAGLGRSKTNGRGYARFFLPREEFYAILVRHGGHQEVLYMERLAPGGSYVYSPDPSKTEGRVSVLALE